MMGCWGRGSCSSSWYWLLGTDLIISYVIQYTTDHYHLDFEQVIA